jgi:tRNA 2-thiouridine synthesizing protein A
MSEHTLDTRRLLCPMPVIKTQDCISDLEIGDTLIVTATDPGVLNDIPAWCRIHGHRVIDSRTEGRELILTIEVCG